MLWGGELVLRDGRVAGQVTSAAWGETLGACVGLAYLADPGGAAVTRDWVTAGEYQADVGGRTVPITVSLRPMYDPDGTKIKPR